MSICSDDGPDKRDDVNSAQIAMAVRRGAGSNGVSCRLSDDGKKASYVGQPLRPGQLVAAFPGRQQHRLVAAEQFLRSGAANV